MHQIHQNRTETEIEHAHGTISHVAKSWGIIEFNKDHVFFDISSLEPAFAGSKLKKLFKVGDTVCFQAEVAAAESRAKYKAISVWLPFSAQSEFSEEQKVANGKYAQNVIERQHDSRVFNEGVIDPKTREEFRQYGNSLAEMLRDGSENK